MLQLVALVLLFIRFCIGGSLPFTGSNQRPLDDGEAKIMRPPTGGTYFDDPSYDCKHASQPHIYDVFSTLELQPEKLSRTIDPNARIHVIGNQPLAGEYSSLDMFVTPIDRAVNPEVGCKCYVEESC